MPLAVAVGGVGLLTATATAAAGVAHDAQLALPLSAPLHRRLRHRPPRVQPRLLRFLRNVAHSGQSGNHHEPWYGTGPG